MLPVPKLKAHSQPDLGVARLPPITYNCSRLFLPDRGSAGCFSEIFLNTVIKSLLIGVFTLLL